MPRTATPEIDRIGWPASASEDAPETVSHKSHRYILAERPSHLRQTAPPKKSMIGEALTADFNPHHQNKNVLRATLVATRSTLPRTTPSGADVNHSESAHLRSAAALSQEWSAQVWITTRECATILLQDHRKWCGLCDWTLFHLCLNLPVRLVQAKGKHKHPNPHS